MVSDLGHFDLRFSLLYKDVKTVCIQQKPFFEFWSFSGLVTCGMILSHDAGQQQQDGFAQLWASVSVLSMFKVG